MVGARLLLAARGVAVSMHSLAGALVERENHHYQRVAAYAACAKTPPGFAVPTVDSEDEKLRRMGRGARRALKARRGRRKPQLDATTE